MTGAFSQRWCPARGCQTALVDQEAFCKRCWAKLPSSYRNHFAEIIADGDHGPGFTQVYANGIMWLDRRERTSR